MTTGLTTKVRCVKIQLSTLTFISMEIQVLSKREQGRSLFLARCIISAKSKKSINESIASLIEQMEDAKLKGNTTKVKILKMCIDRLKKVKNAKQ